MIDLALKCVADDLNAHLPREQRDAKKRIIISSLVDQNGSPPLDTEDMLVLTLTALDEEKNIKDANPAPRGASAIPHSSDKIYLNLHVMFAATHRRYETALAALSAAVGYLKAKPVFDHRNTPRLPEEIRQLHFNLEKLGYAEMAQVWSYLGANYVPAANYTIRVVGVGRRQVDALLPVVETAEVAP